MKRWFRTLSNKIKTSVLVATLLTAQVAGAALPFIPNNVAHAAETCVTDTAGANDQPGQKDLTKLCIDYAGTPTTVATKWNWDETGTSGNGQSMDACNLFDVNNNGLADYAVCVTTQNDPATLQVFNTYSCGDTREDRCTTPIATLSSGTTTCAVSQQNTDPFPAGASSPTDTQAACTIQLSTMPIPVGGTSPKLIDVCSYPSQSPNSDPSDCVVARANAGKLEVIKNLVPAADPGLFNLQVDNVTKAANVGNNGTTGELSVAAGNHTVGELAGTSTTLSNYSASVTCRNLNGTGAVVASGTSTSLSVPVADQSDIVCIITNTRAGGQITVTKVVNNTHGGQATASQFPLFVNATSVTSGATNSYTANQSYTVSETANAVAGYTQTGATCVDTATQASLGTTFTLGANQNVSCTITNSDTAPTLKLVKNVSNTHGGTATAANFQGKINGSNVTWGTANTENAGTAYTLSEAALAGGAGYSASSWVCDGGNQNGSQITLALGQNVTCTITNSDIAPQLTVIKHVVNNYGGGAAANNFTMNVTGTNVSSSSFAGSEAGNTVTLNAGNYSVGESGGPAGYTGSNSSDCSGTIAVGQTKTCTITNSDSPASISGHKYEVNANGTQGSGGTPVQNWTVYLLVNGQPIAQTTTDAGGNYSFGNLNWGNYTLAECQNVSDGCSTWTPIYSPGGVSVNGTSLSSTNNDFGNFKNGSIGGYKWNDLNGNGQLDGNEVKLSNWTVFIDTNNNGTLENGEVSTVTDGNGNYTLSNLAPGTYRVCEQQQTGWLQTSPGSNGCYSITIDQSGESNPNTNFGNQGRGTVTVVKNVNDGFGNVTSDVTTWTWNINGNGGFSTGSSNAQPVAAGTYTVAEVQKANYHVTASSCTNETVPGAPTTSLSATVSAGENVVCTFTNTRDTGTLTVNKVVSPSNDTGKFNLRIDGSTAGTGANVGDGGTTGAVVVTTGTHTVSEVAGTNTSLADYSSTYSCSNEQSGTGTSVVVSVTTSNAVTCTFTNVRYAHIVITKQTLPDGSQKSFAFDASYNLNGFNLTDGQSDNSGNLLPGSYTVGESATSGWDLTGLTCDTNNYQTNGSAVTIALAAGQTTTCTYTNTQRGSVHGTKSEVNVGGGIVGPVAGVTVHLYSGNDNTGTLVGTTTTAADGSYSFTNLVPGNYFVEEVVPTGYTQLSGGGSFTVDPGENETANSTVNFGNFKNGSISGYKWNDLNGNGTKQENEPKLSGWEITLSQDGQQVDETTTDGNGNYSFTDLAPGDYTVCEVSQDGWVQTSAPTCYSITIDLSGESDTAVFGNQGRASITIVKDVDTDGDGVVDETNATDWTWDLSGSYYSDSGISTGATKSNIPAGSYTVTEQQKTDYHFTSVSCDNDSEVTQNETFNVTLEPGDNVTCTFTNTRDTGTVTVTKQLTPSSDEGLFDLQVDGTTDATDVGDNGTTGDVRVLTGTHSVSEVAGTDTDLADYNSSWVCTDGDEGDLYISGTGTTSDEFDVSTGQQVDCTFTNVRRATLTVIKKAFPVNSSQSFNFTLKHITPVLEDVQNENINVLNLLGGTILVKNFQLDDNTDPTLPNNNVSSLSPGVYEVSEDSTSGWDLASMDCGDVTTTKTATSIRFELAAGQQLTCTFVNQKHVVPQVLGESTAVLTNTGLPIVAFTLAAMTLLGTALFVGTTRRQQ